ncbi:aldehyde dehydrogenase family protein [Parahalioglobus pacificus]|uniref:Aldehyde dehydrogenase n=1 Tax=Parahalioglobus pacificus TaxID=930806 RepID=A0A919CKN8_9GAMM|nr:aldehyde dehydrogenase family protein [Halioglobus pacificus]GHD31385.1 aldehyde dehydrogenase [Halioglobus pacificus]
MFKSQLLINGELCEAEGGARFENLAPATEAPAGDAADASPTDMDRAIAAAREAFDTSRWRNDPEFRLACLQQLKAGLLAVNDELRELISAETGAPMGICGASGPQCDVPITFLDYTLEQLPGFSWRRDVGIAEPLGQRSQRYVVKEAIGVVGCITPWNVPLQINLAKCIPALAAGCAVVLKAAPDTPFAAAMLGEVVAKHTDIPPGIFNVITANDPVTVSEQLVCDPRVDMISFTGSTGVGKRIMSLASDTVKKVFLELGGKSANIMLDDADLSQSLLSCLAVCFHAGQGCAIQTRLLIPADRQTEVEELLQSYFTFIEYGDPSSDSQIMGPLINAKQQQRVLDYISLGKKEGARLLLGGGKPAQLDKGYYVEPTVFVDVNNDMRIAREEIFGPVLVVIPYENEADAIRIANDSEYGLSAGVWSADGDRALAVAHQLRAGTVTVNGGNYYSPDVPFGGYKQSGIGREMGPEGFEEYLETKTIAIGVRA